MKRRWTLKMPGWRWLHWNGSALWYSKTTVLAPYHSHTDMRLLWSRRKIVRVNAQNRYI